MSETRETYKILDLALRIGEILLSSGAGAADVTATMLGVTQHLGLRNADVDVTFTLLRMSYQDDPDEVPVLLTRNITQRDIDYDDLTRVHDLVSDVLSDRVSTAEARAHVARINSTDHYLPAWAIVLGSGVVNGAIALILDGGVVVTTAATIAGVAVTILLRYLNRERWPMFYQQIGGGLLATLLALGTTALGLKVDTSLVVTASIVLLLSGIGFMGAIQDALSGFYLTAGARIIEALLATAGLIAGVSAGLVLAPKPGIRLGRPRYLGQTSAWRPRRSAPGGGHRLCARAAFASHLVTPPARPLLAGGGDHDAGLYRLPRPAGPHQSMPWAAACAAMVIGAVSDSIAGRARVPPLVVVVPAIVPMLPGLSIYRGLTYLSAGDSQGILQAHRSRGHDDRLGRGRHLGRVRPPPGRSSAEPAGWSPAWPARAWSACCTGTSVVGTGSRCSRTPCARRLTAVG